MTIHSVSIRLLPPEEFEAFRSTDWVTSALPSSTARELAAVPIPGYSWMRLTRSLEGFDILLDPP